MLDDLAHHPDPYPLYAALRERGVHQTSDGRWVVARAADVEAVLASPDVAIGFTSPPSATGRVDVQTRMARFSDGPAHDRGRAVAEARLATIFPEDLRLTAHDVTRNRLDRAKAKGGEIEVMSALARSVPVAVLAEAMGAADVETVVAATRDLCLALAPPAGRAADDPRPAATAIAQQVAPESGLTDDGINNVALLFQAMDATAGLVGNAVLAAGRWGPAPAEGLVTETNRFDPPVQLTTRLAVRDVQVGGMTVLSGSRLVLLLAAANRDPDRFDRPDVFDPARPPVALTFGTGLRPCPGSAHALALAIGILEAITEADPAWPSGPVTYERRPNLRIPASLTLRV